MSVMKTKAGTWQVRVYDRSTGRRTTRNFKSKRDAQDYETSLKAKLNAGILADPAQGKQTFGTFARRYIEVRDLAVNTQRNYANHLTRLDPVWGHRKLRDLNASDAQALETHLNREFGGNGARNTLIFARCVMNQAFLDRIIERSPFVGVKLKKPRDRREVVLPSWAPVRAVVEGRASRTPKRVTLRQTLIAVMAGSGLRVAEVLGLTTDSVDFLRREITVKRSLQHINEGEARKVGLARFGFYVKDAKSDAGQGRVVPVPQWTLDVLSAWLAENPPEVHRLPFGSPDAAKTRDVELLFGLRTGASASAIVRTARWGTGVNYSPHDLRKLFASTLEQAGLPWKTLRALLGHEGGEGVTGLYVQVDPVTFDQAREILDRAWAGAAGDPGDGAAGEVGSAGAVGT